MCLDFSIPAVACKPVGAAHTMNTENTMNTEKIFVAPQIPAVSAVCLPTHTRPFPVFPVFSVGSSTPMAGFIRYPQWLAFVEFAAQTMNTRCTRKTKNTMYLSVCRSNCSLRGLFACVNKTSLVLLVFLVFLVGCSTQELALFDTFCGMHLLSLRFTGVPQFANFYLFFIFSLAKYCCN